MKGDPSRRGFATRAIHAGQAPDPSTGAVSVPIYQTSTYAFDSFGQHRGYDYARAGNPTRAALEANVAALEGGASAQAFASGMAAITTLLTLVHSDQRIVLSRNVYGGTYRLLTQVMNRYRIAAEWIDTTDLGAVERALVPETRLLFIESPTNPLMEITDIAAVCGLAHRAGAKVAVDNTFMSPYLQLPLAHGADYVVHSTTKFLNGHSDSIGGVLVSAAAEDGDWFAFVQKSQGAILSPFECFLTLRGIKTLPVRMERAQQNARAVATFLAGQRAVAAVHYPGLAEFPGYALQARQASGPGAMLAFDVGTQERARAVLDRVSVLTLAESLGGVETLISHPATMTHASIPAERRSELGIGDGLVRISLGIEDEQDLLDDLDHALRGL